MRRGAAAPPSSRCERERARSVEALFLRAGYDGYMRMDAWGVSMRHDLEHLLAAEAVAEALPLWLRVWHRLVGRATARDQIKNK